MACWLGSVLTSVWAPVSPVLAVYTWWTGNDSICLSRQVLRVGEEAAPSCDLAANQLTAHSLEPGPARLLPASALHLFFHNSTRATHEGKNETG